MARIGANIHVNGIVQGVGFRPFIHKQITDHSLCGFIRNTSEGVEIEIEGEADRVRQFEEELWTKAPALAVVREVRSVPYSPLKDYTDFRIIESKALPHRRTLISPDVSLCEDCRRELFDPENRRFRHPFINCTNCGPRYTIVKDVPYDRPLTSMAAFPMCPRCEAEYSTISDRRYHAQPVCCPDCGPVLSFRRGTESVLGNEASLTAAVRLLEAGGILAVKGLGGFHLAARADRPDPALRLRERKGREAKPFALMARDLETARRLCDISKEEEALLLSRERPIVLLKKKDRSAYPYLSENDRLGIMLPYTPLHELLLADGPDCLIMTSANLSDKPIIKDNDEALEQLSAVADAFLLHNRRIVARCDDSLIWEWEKKPYFARRSRGFAPRPITVPALSQEGPSLLALGAEQKASFAFSKGSSVFSSPHIGDLKNWETLSHYEETIRRYEALFDLKPQALICDLHPDYLSSDYAEKRAAREGIPLIRAQHHHAHLVACMADRHLEGKTLGIIWDGTGLGTDGTVWGSEFLIGDENGFERAASLLPFKLPGGDLCSRELWRNAISLLSQADALPETWPASISGSAAQETVRAVQNQLALSVNCPLSTSMGRLFDAASALLGLCQEASYEGQGAVLLESAAAKNEENILPVLIESYDNRLVLNEIYLIRHLVSQLRDGVPQDRLAARFMNSLAEGAVCISRRLRESFSFRQIVLSGGCFQNLYLLGRLTRRLNEEGFQVYHHERVSPNDEGLALGQLLIGAAALRKQERK